MQPLQILDFFEKLTGKKPSYSGGENVYVHCPLAPYTHKGGVDNRPSMSVRPNDSGYSPAFCWSPNCLFKGHLKALVEELSEYDFSLYKEFFIDLFHKYEKRDYNSFIDNFSVNLDSLFEVKEKVYSKDLLDQYKPLTYSWRGLSQDTISEFDLRVDESEQRVLFPVFNSEHNLVGASGRTLINSRIKYKNYWNFKKTLYLYGEHIQNSDTCIVVEGQYDVLKVYDSIRNCYNADVIGIFGAFPSDTQCKKILTRYVRCLCFFDNDAAGSHAMVELAKRIIKDIPLYYVPYRSAIIKDAGEMTKEQIRKNIELATRIQIK